MAKNKKRARHTTTTDKRAHTSANPTTSKRPFRTAPTQDENRRRISWRFQMLDLDGPHSWLTLQGTQRRGVLDKMAEFERNTAEAWVSQGHGANKRLKRIPVENLCADAQQRLRQIKRDDLDVLWEFRLTGSQRIWCVRYDETMWLLWWDPNHEVCPTSK